MAVVVVREASRFGPCHLLGTLVGERAMSTAVDWEGRPPLSTDARRAVRGLPGLITMIKRRLASQAEQGRGV